MDVPKERMPEPKPSPWDAPGTVITDAAMGALFDLAAPAFAEKKPPTSRSWQPPGAGDLQKSLPQYDIIEFVARGGMGAVYKGMQRSLRRVVAIKVLPPGIDDRDMHYAERFKHEARAMARLTHPHIVAVHDAGETEDGLLYFVMEFVEGTDICQLITRDGRVEQRRAMQITSAVCDALSFAHEAGIVHRDIKPSNIMLDNKGRVKVADFGLARTINIEEPRMTRSDLAVGTPDFAAPETLVAGTQVDQRADIYALGVTLYQMLTGRIPRGKFDAPSTVSALIDPRLDAIVDKAMQADREKRYTTALEMKNDLERMARRAEIPLSHQTASGGIPIATRTDSAPQVSGSAITQIVSPATAALATSEAAEKNAPRRGGMFLPWIVTLVAVVGAAAWMFFFQGDEAPGHTSKSTGRAAQAPAYRFPDGPPGFVKELIGHSGAVSGSILTLPDSRRALTHASSSMSGADALNEMILWDIETAKPVWKTTLRAVAGVISATALLHASGRIIAVQRGPMLVLTLLEVEGGTVSRLVPVEIAAQSSATLATAPDGSRFMLALFPAAEKSPGSLILQLWDAESTKALAAWDAGRCTALSAIAWLDDERVLVGFTDAQTGEESLVLANINRPGDMRRIPVREAGISNHFIVVPGLEDHILTRTQSNHLALFDLGKSKLVRHLPSPSVQRQFAFLDSRRVLGLSARSGDALRLWDSATSRLLWELPDARLHNQMAVSADGRYAITNVEKSPGQGKAGSSLLVWRLPAAVK